MKLTDTIILLTGVFTAAAGLAVEGYKGLKFGENPTVLAKSKYCETQWQKQNDSFEYGQIMVCPKFRFGKDSVVAVVNFLDKKLAQVVITVPTDKFKQVYDGLASKYGNPSSIPKDLTQNPNTVLDIRFDKDTIIYRTVTDKNNQRSVLLIYTVADFEKRVEKLQRKDIEDAL